MSCRCGRPTRCSALGIDWRQISRSWPCRPAEIPTRGSATTRRSRGGAAGQNPQSRPAQPETPAKKAEKVVLGIDEHCLASLLAYPYLFGPADEALQAGGEAAG